MRKGKECVCTEGLCEAKEKKSFKRTMKDMKDKWGRMVEVLGLRRWSLGPLILKEVADGRAEV